MTKVTIYKNKENVCVGFRVEGHAGMSEEGTDIVCAAISMLTINTMNAIEQFTDTSFRQDVDETSSSIEFQLDKPSKDATLLLEPMVLGLQTLEDNKEYEDYIDLIFEEV